MDMDHWNVVVITPHSVNVTAIMSILVVHT